MHETHSPIKSETMNRETSPLGQDRSHHLRQEDGTGWQRCGVVHGDQPHTGMRANGLSSGKYGLNTAPPHSRINVNTFRTGCGETGQIGHPVVDAGIEAEFLGHVSAFVWPARDADGAGTLKSGPIWPTTEPTAPEAAATHTLSPAVGLPISSNPI